MAPPLAQREINRSDGQKIVNQAAALYSSAPRRGNGDFIGTERISRGR
jgi:hypothetical protein